jgi:hypothetical protein
LKRSVSRTPYASSGVTGIEEEKGGGEKEDSLSQKMGVLHIFKM